MKMNQKMGQKIKSWNKKFQNERGFKFTRKFKTGSHFFLKDSCDKR
jgi:hypothetical protein